MAIKTSLKDLRRQGFLSLQEVQPDPNLRSLEADLILLRILNVEGAGREYLISNSNELISNEACLNYLEFIRRRSAGEPLAYVLNCREFYSRDFYVDHRVLIPRPDTEILVERALSKIISNDTPINIIDIGTGSGCVIITMIAELVKLGQQGLVKQSIATDISEDALKVAKINASRLLAMNVMPKWLVSDLFSERLVVEISNSEPLVLLANLPYIDEADPETCDFVRRYEPALALFSEVNGLAHIIKLMKQVSDFAKSLKFKENSISIFLEIGYKQANKVEFEANKIGFRSVIIHTDLAGRDRVVECVI